MAVIAIIEEGIGTIIDSHCRERFGTIIDIVKEDLATIIGIVEEGFGTIIAIVEEGFGTIIDMYRGMFLDTYSHVSRNVCGQL